MKKVLLCLAIAGVVGWASDASGHDGGWGITRGGAQHALKTEPLVPRGDLEGVVIVARRARCEGDFSRPNFLHNNQRYFNHLFCTVTDSRGRTWKLTFHATGQSHWQYSNLRRVGNSATSGGAAVRGGFMSPSGNIRCRYFSSTSTVGCLTRNDGIETMMTAYGRPYAQPASHLFPAGPVLGYGSSINLGGEFRCTSRTDGMSCRSLLSGRCFLTAREGRRLTCATPPAESVGDDCNPNYAGACLDKPGDYDCIGGSGDGPNYTGTVRVVGEDVYGLDSDGDGIGCESS